MSRPIIGVSENIIKIHEVINHIADTGLNTVICGESGVGKEVVAQTLYQKSSRNGKPFIKVNCAALPDGLLESELFGYEKGAFTGADRKTRGKFELANKGVLMLDEIGDMSLSLQAKLLHVLQGGAFAPLGSEKEFTTDTWVIAATNHELEQDIADGKFREDLYYRLNIIKIYIQPLRERPEDIPHLIEYYLKEYSQLFDSDKIFQPNERTIEALKRYHWPGNVRELQNILKRMLVLGDADKILGELNQRTASETSPSDPFMPVTIPNGIMQEYLISPARIHPTSPLFLLNQSERPPWTGLKKRSSPTCWRKPAGTAAKPPRF